MSWKLDENPSVFEKGALIMVPSVTHRYGSGEEDMKLYFYTEIYHGKEEIENIRIETVLQHQAMTGQPDQEIG